MSEKVIEALKKAKEAGKRNFKQSIDLALNLKNIDLKKAENKVKTEIVLPNPVPKAITIGIFADALVNQVNDLGEGIILIKKSDIDGFDKKKMKILANKCQSFLAEAPLMPLVGKKFGPVLAVRNKMPKPIPTLSNIEPLVTRTRNTIKVALKLSPVIHCIVGTEDMEIEKVDANIEAMIKGVGAILPRGEEQIRNGYVKLTMGKAEKFDIK